MFDLFSVWKQRLGISCLHLENPLGKHDKASDLDERDWPHPWKEPCKGMCYSCNFLGSWIRGIGDHVADTNGRKAFGKSPVDVIAKDIWKIIHGKSSGRDKGEFVVGSCWWVDNTTEPNEKKVVAGIVEVG